MRNVWGKITCVCAAAVLALTGCAGKERTVVESLRDRAAIAAVSEHVYKTVQNANPVSPNIFCADPTAVEYEDRLYVYATNDTQQAEKSDKNDYVHIKSFVVFSTDDMVNWAYHGRIEVGQIAPWIQNSWAPSVVSRKEKDGKTHFYLYFSNNGNGVGVLTAEHPLGPWSDPLGKPLIWQGMPGLQNCPAPFDPGVCIDENGTGWLSFGGGVPANGAKVHSNVPKIVRLAIRTCGTGCVIAKSFARIFYRNAINIGLPILECEAAAEEIQGGDEVQVDFDTGVITDLTSGKIYRAQPFPPFIQNIIAAGGLLQSLIKEQSHE